jgi:geranylgeranyl pyrophosphate synthase
MDEARSAVGRALGSLAVAPASPEKDALEDLAKFIVDRKI